MELESTMQRVEQMVERILWNSRLMVLVAVNASIMVALSMLVMATLDVLSVFRYLAAYISLPYNNPLASDSALLDTRDSVRTTMITGVVKAIDGYLIAAILLIFALGLYELFVNRIDIAQRSESAARLLQVRSIDDLKDRVAKVVLLVLIIEFFQYALQLSFNTALDLLYLAIGILLIGGAIYLTKDKGPAKPTAAGRRRMRVVAGTQRPPAVGGEVAGDDGVPMHMR